MPGSIPCSSGGPSGQLQGVGWGMSVGSGVETVSGDGEVTATAIEGVGTEGLSLPQADRERSRAAVKRDTVRFMRSSFAGGVQYIVAIRRVWGGLYTVQGSMSNTSIE